MATTFEILSGLKSAGQIETNPLGKVGFTNEDERLIANVARTQKDQGLFGGGPIQKFSDTLLIGNYAQVAASKKILEASGMLSPTEDNVGDIMSKRRINADLLEEIGRETGKGGLLTGQYQASESVFQNFLKELPRATLGTFLDIVADPLTYLAGVGLVKRAVSGIGGVAKVGIKALPKGEESLSFLARNFLRPSQRRPAELTDVIIRRKVAENEALKKAALTVNPTTTLSSGMKQRVMQVVRGGITEDSEIRAMAEPLRKSIDDLSLDITKLSSKLLREETFQQGQGNYIGTFYRKFLFEDEAGKASILTPSTFSIKVPKGRFIARKDFSESVPKRVQDFLNLPSAQRTPVQSLIKSPEFRRVMNAVDSNGITDEAVNNLARAVARDMPGVDIKELRFAVHVDRFLDANQKVINRSELLNQASFESFSKFFNEKIRKGIGQIDEVTLPAFKTLADMGVAKSRLTFFDEIAKNTKFSSDLPFDNWDRLPVDKFYGKLSGKWVDPSVMEEIQTIKRGISQMDNNWLKGLRFWKAMKTAYNPGTIARNDITNYAILNPLGGLPPWRLDIYARAIRGFFKKDELWIEFEKSGGNLSSQEVAELRGPVKNLFMQDKKEGGVISKFYPTLSKFHDRVLNFYGSQDRFFKFANFVKGTTEDGLSSFEAMQKANMYLIDYSDVPPIIERIRNSPIGVPFLSFTYGVSFPLAKTLATRPDLLADYFKVLNGIRTLNPYQMTREQRDAEGNVLPDWLKRKPHVVLPYRDKFGNRQILDLEYILPFNMFETLSFMPGGPYVTMLAAITTNTDPFTKLPIIEDGSSRLDAAAAGTKFVYRMAAPSMAPGGFGFDKVSRAITQEPEKLSETPRGLTSTLIDVFGGLRAFPVNPSISAKRRARERYFQLLNIQGEMKSIRRAQIKGFIDEEEAQKQIERAKEKMNKVLNPNQ